ncbi:MAG: hypothetical protein JXQ23_12010 [Clostridia bacterium]|nr:hypothetical protein [Clostridia bacterium]
MTNLNRLFAQYFIIAIICVLLVMILIFNYTSTIFFTDFLATTYEKSNDTVFETIKVLLENDAFFGFYRRNFLESIAQDGTIELILFQDEEHIMSVGPINFVIGPDQSTFIHAFEEDNSIKYVYTFTVYEKDFTLTISRLKDIKLVEQNAKYLNRLNLMYLAVFIFALLVTTLLSLMLSKRFNKPIITIKENINYIKRGQYGKIKETDTKAKELKELSVEINQLAISKENEDNIRKRLSSDIVHELKTPITALSANLEAILDGIYEADHDRIKILLDQTNRLSRLVNGLSKLTILETNAEELNKERIDLSSIVKDIIITFEPAILDQNLKFASNIEEDIFVMGNVDKLLQSFINVISNALKYTEKGSIKVNLYKDHGKAVFEVKDTGIGIDEKDLPYVFERFYRSDESRSRQTGGAGIGLAITKAIIQAHDGEVKVESTINVGSTFTIILDTVD